MQDDGGRRHGDGPDERAARRAAGDQGRELRDRAAQQASLLFVLPRFRGRSLPYEYGLLTTSDEHSRTKSVTTFSRQLAVSSFPNDMDLVTK